MKPTNYFSFIHFRQRIYVLSFLFIFGIYRKANGQTNTDIPQNVTEVKQWIDQHFAKGKIPPFSFVYDGKKCRRVVAT